MTGNTREKHSFFQLSTSVGFPTRSCAHSGAPHFVIMTGKNEFLMCYLHQLQRALALSIRHTEGGGPGLGGKALTWMAISRLQKSFFSFDVSVKAVLKSEGQFTSLWVVYKCWVERARPKVAQ